MANLRYNVIHEIHCRVFTEIVAEERKMDSCKYQKYRKEDFCLDNEQWRGLQKSGNTLKNTNQIKPKDISGL
jgi:hypothetical protein